MVLYCIFATLLCIGLSIYIGFLKVEFNYICEQYKYANELAGEYKKLLNKYNEELGQTIQVLKDQENNAKYNLYFVNQLIKGLNYASHFLKPRKKKEMWHIANNLLSFEEWIKKNENNVK